MKMDVYQNIHGYSGQEPLVSLRNLTVTFHTNRSGCRAVNDVSFDIGHGEALGIVGESGSGKTVTCLSLVRLLPRDAEMTASVLRFDGRSLLDLSEGEMRKLRGREIAIVFQNPMSALNPYLTIERQVTEAMEAHLGLTRREARTRAITLLEMVAIPEPERRIRWYPYQFSGGMQQRVMLAMALSCGPKLLIADEPTTALDATVQAGILDLLVRLRVEGFAPTTGAGRKLAMLFVSHDLDIVGHMCERVLVMYGGRVVEEGPAHAMLSLPLHPYTKALLECVPRLDSKRMEYPLPTIPGSPPSAANMPPGCAFHPRCPQVMEKCKSVVPQLVAAAPMRRVACLLFAAGR